MIHASPNILNDLSDISTIKERVFLNALGYIKGIIPSMIRMKAKTIATISMLSIF